jgi:hypothetical protein
MGPSIACPPDRVVLVRQSEFLQLLTFVVLTSFLIHRNSPESRDSDDEMQRSLDWIEKRLKALEGEGGKAKAGRS